MPKSEQCPRCHALGKDTRGNNLAVYDDGHSYCYSCRYYVPSPTTVTSLKQKLSRSARTTANESYNLGDVTFRIPPTPKAWLTKYGVTDDEIHKESICWNAEKKLLTFPIYNGEALMGFTARYFGENKEYPRYIHKFRAGFYKLFSQQHTNVFILVEDYVSALKVGRHYNAIPILGSYIPLSLILSLVYQQPQLRIWLDRDKAIEAMKYAARARQFIPDCGTIVTEKDPKEYTNKEITEIVFSTLKSPSELGTIQ